MQNLKIYVLSLRRATERRELMKRQFESLPSGFAFEFFDAIDAGAGEHLAFGQYDKLRAILVRGKEMSAGERACFASHYSLWQKCVESNEPFVVLEDDVELLGDFWAELGRIRQSEYAYVRLMYLSKKASFYEVGEGVFLSFDSLAGTQGYYLTPKAARALIESAQSWYRPVDDYMDMFYIHHVPNICVKPCIKEADMGTTIAGRGIKPPFYLKLIREIARCALQIRARIFRAFFLSRLFLPQSALEHLSRSKAHGAI